MLISLRLLTLMGLGVTLGFLLALFSTWTGVLEVSRTEVSYQIMNAPNGDILKVPVHESNFSISAHSEPYRMSPVVDLFNNHKDPQ